MFLTLIFRRKMSTSSEGGWNLQIMAINVVSLKLKESPEKKRHVKNMRRSAVSQVYFSLDSSKIRSEIQSCRVRVRQHLLLERWLERTPPWDKSSEWSRIKRKKFGVYTIWVDNTAPDRTLLRSLFHNSLKWLEQKLGIHFQVITSFIQLLYLEPITIK